MPEAPRQRPSKHAVLHTFTARIRAAPDDVFAAASARLDPGPVAAYAFLSDPGELLIVSQGGWWYRGEYRVTADLDGATLEHVIVNIAQLGEKAALVAARKTLATAPLAFHELVMSLRADLEQQPR